MKATGLARIGNDAVLRHTNSGDAVANISLAFSYGRKGDDGKRPTQWVEASLWGKRAELMVNYLTKGKQIFVSLEDLHIEIFDKKDGSSGSKMVARIADLEFTAQSSDDKPAQQSQPAQKTSKKNEFYDDDIMF